MSASTCVGQRGKDVIRPMRGRQVACFAEHAPKLQAIDQLDLRKLRRRDNGSGAKLARINDDCARCVLRVHNADQLMNDVVCDLEDVFPFALHDDVLAVTVKL